ncbi:uncharacterized protein LOC108907792 isoform X2 [Anoplophora glabripennis]|nr:uncharacterized protein LOC108907792 isoform X2 [Anoplophora glabripennis]
MRLFLFFILGTLAVQEIRSVQETCHEIIKECHSTNYKEYVNCIRRRQKRSTDCNIPCDSDNCINTCNECDCNSCGYSSCQNACDSCCSSCCNNYNVCTNNHCCHKTCHAQCRSSSCRSSCRKTCYDRIKDLDEKTASNITNINSNDNKHNITTIIHLNNVINNTNVIDIPISLNNTNQQNITLYERGLNAGSNGTQSCCVVISPRQCAPHNEYPFYKCFHYRSKQCGEYCTAPIVHKEQQQICQTTYPGSAPSCRQSVMYIPQPQPRCTYQSTWPYVACGISRSVSCAGCYSHYVNSNAQNYLNCPSACYDDGFGIGPYYRQGPVYRQTYSHAPCFSCFGYGGYGGYEGYGGAYGGYPVFGGYGGYPGYGGAYPPFGGYPAIALGAGTGFNDPNVMTYGSWAPGIENPFQQTNNNSDLGIDPLISVGPNLSTNPYGDPYRVSRELEIEVNYEPKSDAQAEVKIKNSNKPVEDDSDKVDLKNTTQPPLDSKSA